MTNTMTPQTTYRVLASGATAEVAADGRVLAIFAADEEFYEGPTCSICDGLGHGYPGAGPCPLEERGYDAAREDEAYERSMGVFA